MSNTQIPQPPQAPVPQPMPQVQQPMPQVQQPMPQVQQPMPQVQQPMPQVQQPMPQVQQPMPQVQQPMPQVQQSVSVKEEVATIKQAYKPLWKDRKRILGMPITFTRYEVTNDRLVKHRGLFRTETDELLLYRILDIKLVRTLGQKLFGMGTIVLYTADKSHDVIELKNIKKSDDVRRFLSKIVEQERASKGVTGREIYGASAAAHCFADLDGDGIPD